MLVKLVSERWGLPALVGYLSLGFLLGTGDQQWNFLTPTGHDILTFLATIGLAVLLFRVGLESNLAGLLKQLPKASLIWIGDILGSILVGYAVSIYILGLPWITALIIGVALSATSVGLSISAWQDQQALNSVEGEFLIDVAELDDISAVLLMALLFALLPEIQQPGSRELSSLAFRSGLIFLGKLLAFGAICVLFSRYFEKSLTHFFTSRESPPDPMLAVMAVALVFAALAGLLGFSVAIGAFLVGLVFSRDPEAVKLEASFQPLYELFSPFFFIGIGLHVDLAVLGQAWGPGLILLGAAIFGKLVADGLPVVFLQGGPAGLLIGFSMVPRAEIALVIMTRGRELGDWAVPSHIYSAMVIACAATCLLAPLVVRRLLLRWPPQKAD